MIGWRWSSRWFADISGLALSSSLLIQSCAHSLVVKFSSNHCTQPTNLLHNCDSGKVWNKRNFEFSCVWGLVILCWTEPLSLSLLNSKGRYLPDFTSRFCILQLRLWFVAVINTYRSNGPNNIAAVKLFKHHFGVVGGWLKAMGWTGNHNPESSLWQGSLVVVVMMHNGGRSWHWVTPWDSHHR